MIIIIYEVPTCKDGDQNKLETEMDVFLPLLSQILRPFGEWIKACFYHVLKFEHRSMIREVGTEDSHQRNVLKCGEKVGTISIRTKFF